jgi:hypothetical protein
VTDLFTIEARCGAIVLIDRPLEPDETGIVVRIRVGRRERDRFAGRCDRGLDIDGGIGEPSLDGAVRKRQRLLVDAGLQ